LDSIQVQDLIGNKFYEIYYYTYMAITKYTLYVNGSYSMHYDDDTLSFQDPESNKDLTNEYQTPETDTKWFIQSENYTTENVWAPKYSQQTTLKKGYGAFWDPIIQDWRLGGWQVDK
jgi:hypothetical protein